MFRFTFVDPVAYNEIITILASPPAFVSPKQMRASSWDKREPPHIEVQPADLYFASSAVRNSRTESRPCSLITDVQGLKERVREHQSKGVWEKLPSVELVANLPPPARKSEACAQEVLHRNESVSSDSGSQQGQTSRNSSTNELGKGLHQVRTSIIPEHHILEAVNYSDQENDNASREGYMPDETKRDSPKKNEEAVPITIASHDFIEAPKPSDLDQQLPQQAVQPQQNQVTAQLNEVEDLLGENEEMERKLSASQESRKSSVYKDEVQENENAVPQSVHSQGSIEDLKPSDSDLQSPQQTDQKQSQGIAQLNMKVQDPLAASNEMERKVSEAEESKRSSASQDEVQENENVAPHSAPSRSPIENLKPSQHAEQEQVAKSNDIEEQASESQESRRSSVYKDEIQENENAALQSVPSQSSVEAPKPSDSDSQSPQHVEQQQDQGTVQLHDEIQDPLAENNDLERKPSGYQESRQSSVSKDGVPEDENALRQSVPSQSSIEDLKPSQHAEQEQVAESIDIEEKAVESQKVQENENAALQSVPSQSSVEAPKPSDSDSQSPQHVEQQQDQGTVQLNNEIQESLAESNDIERKPSGYQESRQSSVSKDGVPEDENAVRQSVPSQGSIILTNQVKSLVANVLEQARRSNEDGVSESD